MTPIDEIAGLRLGSRPASRAASGDRTTAPTLASLRAIPWSFAWSQARVELPGWFGVGSALEAWERQHGEPGVDRLRELYRTWPFLGSVLDNAAMALARSDMPLARGYASLATAPGDADRWRIIEDEHGRTSRTLARVIGETRQPGESPTTGLRAPYVDTLSVAQLELLRELRRREAEDPGHPDVDHLRTLVRLTISGLAAALQGTG